MHAERRLWPQESRTYDSAISGRGWWNWSSQTLRSLCESCMRYPLTCWNCRLLRGARDHTTLPYDGRAVGTIRNLDAIRCLNCTSRRGRAGRESPRELHMRWVLPICVLTCDGHHARSHGSYRYSGRDAAINRNYEHNDAQNSRFHDPAWLRHDLLSSPRISGASLEGRRWCLPCPDTSTAAIRIDSNKTLGRARFVLVALVEQWGWG